MKREKIKTALLGALIFTLIGCASIHKTPDLHQKSDAMFNKLEKEESKRPNSTDNSNTGEETSFTGKEQTLRADKPHSYKFKETGYWKLSKAETQLDAERLAEDDALGKALRSSGIETYYGFSDVLSQQAGDGEEAVARYIQLWGKGVTKWERLGKPEFIIGPDGTFECRVKIKGEVVFNGEPDPYFEIQFKTGGKELGLSRTVLMDGENLEFSAALTKDAFLQVLSVDQEQNVYLIYPNALYRFSKVPAGQVFRFPPAGSGLGLRAALPPGMNQNTEVLHVIATKTAPLFTENYLAGAENTLSSVKLKEVMGRLAKLKRSEWVMAVLPYQIIR